MLVNSIPKVFSLANNKSCSAEKPNLYSTTLQSDRFEKQSLSFGINIPIHAKQRIEDRGISIKNVVDTIKNGSKFLTVEKGKERIVSLNCKTNGKVPNDTLLVVTDKTGNTVVTACKVSEEECEIAGNKLKKRSHHNPQNSQVLESWNGKFNGKIFDSIEFTEEQPHLKIDWRNRNRRNY